LQTDEPTEALAHLMDEPIGVALLEGGALTVFSERLFRQWREQHPLMEAVGVSGDADAPEPALVRMDCETVIAPPVDPARVAGAIGDALRRREHRVGLIRGGEEIASRVLQATQALVTAVELKDAYTRGRADRVALFAGILADELGGLDVDRIRTAARIMDVGKTGVPEDILNKTDRLTEDEYEEVKRHPVISWEMLRHLFRDDVILGVARHHHERWDGRGYPDGLRGEEIPLAARVVAVADSLDAITSTRAFRQARLWSEAVEEVVAGSGSRYDPNLVEILSRAQDRMLVGA
ncbi:MAG: HD domain-containing protein, partial [Gemmatimonadetes bacterium]|nr:HD domain-containing protein [Gemmatimonadota bacterium]NIQ52073.1 HD domain-containing protein [Gemmatimonadota bacterium]NIU72177.1 HD domain-containing protein [Gammaproteobacteria bacterium]NIX42717.1 HD domain-containing protein [Gemmatimonadota bacterium]NIY06883.1 HD domain-containing protein [Gemmatimonadota bacterium]